MMLPRPYTVQRKPYQAGSTDAHGNVAPGWGALVDLPVHAIAPGAMVEDDNGGRDLSEVLYTLYCPAGTVCGEYDQIVLNGASYAVDGRPKDYTRGPWTNPIAGVTIMLRAVEG